MRTIAPLTAFAAVLTALLGCSETNLSTVEPPKDLEEELDEDVPTPPEEPVEPIADAGPDRVWATGDLVALDGSASYDPQGLAPLVYSWSLTSFPSGSSVQVSALDVESPTFTADVAGTYSLELTVMNTAGIWDSTPATVTINVEDDPVYEPIANAGPDQSPNAGSLVQLDGTGSFDPQGLEPLEYLWQIIQRPAGSQAVLAGDDSATPTFSADASGLYVVELTVRNSAGVQDSTPDVVVIDANPVILPPESDAGIDIQGTTGEVVQLDGSGSFDPQGLEPLTYDWVFVNRPSGSNAVLQQATSVAPTFTPDVAGFYQIELVVTNTANVPDPTSDKVDVNVGDVVVQEPVADAGADFGVLPLEAVQLDGSGSYDPAGLEPLTYAWTMISQPAGSTATLDNTSVDRPNFFADLAGAYVFELTVMNSAGTWDTTPDVVTIEAIPIDGFYVEVSWDNTNDLDLHILDGNSPMWSDGDACYCNMNPNWGGAGSLDDPSLDADAIDGFGPETTTIDEPATGSYEIAVHYYGLGGAHGCGAFTSCPSSTATVKVYLGGVLTQEYSRLMTDSDDVWTVATINWPSGAINTIDQMGTTSEWYCY